MTREELLGLLDLLEQLRLPAEQQFGLSGTDPIWNMTLYLVRRHLTGRLVTPTSLARAAGVSHSTAVRRADEMRRAGLLVLRPRTRSGRSFSVHPSEELLDRTIRYAACVKLALARSFGLQSDVASFYFGTSYLSARIIPDPIVRTPGARHAGGLDILLFEDPAFFIDADLQRRLSQLMGCEVRIHGCSLEDLRRIAFDNAARPVSAYDLVAVDLPWIGDFGSAGVLMRLDALVAGSGMNTAEFFPAEWEGTHVDEAQYALPFQTNPELLFYRADLLGAHGLTPPQTTDDLLAVARQLHAPDRGLYGVSWTGGRGIPVGHAFIQFLADFGQPVLNLRRVADGYEATRLAGPEFRPRIDTPRGWAAAEFMLELLEVSPPGVLETNWEHQIEHLRRGRVAMAYEWASRASRLADDKVVQQTLRFLPHPKGIVGGNDVARDNVSPVGGFALGIPANLAPKRLRDVWEALEWLTAPEAIKLIVRHGGCIMPRFSVAADPEVRAASPVIPAVDAMAKRGQLRLWPRPPVAEFTSIVGILGVEIHDLLTGRQGVRSALRRAQQRVDRMMRANGRY